MTPHGAGSRDRGAAAEVALRGRRQGHDEGGEERGSASDPRPWQRHTRNKLPSVVLEGITASTAPLAVRKKPSKKYGT